MRRILTSLFSSAGVVGVAAAANSDTGLVHNRRTGVVSPVTSTNPFCYPSRKIYTSMKAVLVTKFGDEKQMKVANVEVPKPDPNEILIKVEAVGLNRVETMIRKGWFGDIVTPPYVPGTDVAGTVEEVGDRVNNFKRGDRVYSIKSSSGAYAQYCTAPAEFVSPLARRLTYEQGAALGVPYTTAYKALFMRAKPKRGDIILVHGASGVVGLAAVQMAKSKGYKVIGTAGTQEGLDLVQNNGADFVFNHRENGYIDKIKEATKGKGVNVILEMMADKNLINDLLIVAPHSRIVMIGFKGPVQDLNPGMAMMVEANIMGIAIQSSTEDEYKEMLEAINQGQKSWVNPQIAKEYSLYEISQAHTDLEGNDGAIGKRVLKPNLEQ